MKNIVLIFIMFTAFVDGWSQNAKENTSELNLTLEQCLEYALTNSNNQKLLMLNYQALEIQYLQAKKERLPDLFFTGSQGLSNINNPALPTSKNPSLNGNYNLNSGVMIYSGGAITKTITQNKLRTEQTVFQIQQANNNLSIQVIQAFLSVIGNEELLKFQESLIATSKEQMLQGRERYQVGSILESDYLLLESQYANDQYNIINTRTVRDNNMLLLKNLLSVKPGESLKISTPDISAFENVVISNTLLDVLEKAKETMPDFVITQYDVEIAKTAVKIAEAGYLPKLSLNAGIGTGYVSGTGAFDSQLADRFNQQIALGLTVPIFSKGQITSNVNQNKIRLQKAEIQQNQTELELMNQIEKQYLSVVNNYAKYEAAELRQKAAKANFKSYELQYGNGLITTVDLLLQQNSYLNAMNDFVQSKYSYVLGIKVLDVFMGKEIKY
jgi:outer membrane protein